MIVPMHYWQFRDQVAEAVRRGQFSTSAKEFTLGLRHGFKSSQISEFAQFGCQHCGLSAGDAERWSVRFIDNCRRHSG